MIEDRIFRIEARIHQAKSISPEARGELLSLLAALRDDLKALPPASQEDAESVARFAEASAHEVTREEKKPLLAEAALTGLQEAAADFKIAHPKTAGTINRIAMILSNMGM